MIVEGLIIPERLITLVDTGIWPRTIQQAEQQNLRSLVPADRIRAIAPEEETIYLSAANALHTVASELKGNEQFWKQFGALHEIDPARTLIIGDFGIGSDTAIACDYRHEIHLPSVIRLKWHGVERKTNWVGCASSFDEFITMLGL